ncbi:MAG: class B sortase [Actinomycetia bacterium]|nr:class B sortase [Actinomycetes bacterium]
MANKSSIADKFLTSILLGAAIAGIAYAGFLVALQAYNYVQYATSNNNVRLLAGDSNSDSLRAAVGLGNAQDQGGQTPESIAAAQRRIIDFAALKKINPEIIGWIYIPNSRIDYPIAQAKDNDYYLHHDFYGRRSFSGCIFLDKAAKPDFTSQDSPVYGHHMRNKSMFGSLVYFRQDSFAKSHQIAFIYLPDKTIKYQFVMGQELSTTELPASKYDFNTMTMITCDYDQVGNHYMVREKFLNSRAPGEADPNDPPAAATAANTKK